MDKLTRDLADMAKIHNAIGGIDDQWRHRDSFNRGDQVRITGTSFEGCVGLFCHHGDALWSGRGRERYKEDVVIAIADKGMSTYYIAPQHVELIQAVLPRPPRNWPGRRFLASIGLLTTGIVHSGNDQTT